MLLVIQKEAKILVLRQEIKTFKKNPERFQSSFPETKRAEDRTSIERTFESTISLAIFHLLSYYI